MPMPRHFFHHGIAAFLLAFAFLDLAVVDVVFPEHCLGEQLGFKVAALADTAKPSRLVSWETTETSGVQSTTRLTIQTQVGITDGTHESCCFLCCPNQLIPTVPASIVPIGIGFSHHRQALFEPVPPPQKLYHPPRLV